MNYRATAILNHSHWSKNLIKACQIELLMAISDINTGKQVLALSEIEQSVYKLELPCPLHLLYLIWQVSMSSKAWDWSDWSDSIIGRRNRPEWEVKCV